MAKPNADWSCFQLGAPFRFLPAAVGIFEIHEVFFEASISIRNTTHGLGGESFMDQEKEMLDINFCLRKESEYQLKARAATDHKLRLAYEAAAQEYAYRATSLREKEKS